MQEATLTPPRRSRFATRMDAFRWLKTPGMEMAPPQQPQKVGPRPLVNRCGCGKRISNGRECCRSCGMAGLEEIAGCIKTREALNMFLAQFSADEQAEVLAAIGPMLNIEEVSEVEA